LDGALPQTLLGELTALPQAPQQVLLLRKRRRGEEGRTWKEKEGVKGEGKGRRTNWGLEREGRDEPPPN